jgi:hypothetical protein
MIHALKCKAHCGLVPLCETCFHAINIWWMTRNNLWFWPCDTCSMMSELVCEISKQWEKHSTKIAKNTSEETVHYNRTWLSTPFREKIKILQHDYNIWKHCCNLCQNWDYHSYNIKKKGKAVPLQAWSGPEGSRKLRFPDFMTTAQDGGKVVSLTHRPPLPPGNTLGTHFC